MRHKEESILGGSDMEGWLLVSPCKLPHCDHNGLVRLCPAYGQTIATCLQCNAQWRKPPPESPPTIPDDPLTCDYIMQLEEAIATALEPFADLYVMHRLAKHYGYITYARNLLKIAAHPRLLRKAWEVVTALQYAGYTPGHTQTER